MEETAAHDIVIASTGVDGALCSITATGSIGRDQLQCAVQVRLPELHAGIDCVLLRSDLAAFAAALSQMGARLRGSASIDDGLDGSLRVAGTVDARTGCVRWKVGLAWRGADSESREVAVEIVNDQTYLGPIIDQVGAVLAAADVDGS